MGGPADRKRFYIIHLSGQAGPSRQGKDIYNKQFSELSVAKENGFVDGIPSQRDSLCRSTFLNQCARKYLTWPHSTLNTDYGGEKVRK